VPSRQLDFPVFDADNHMYETRDALTKFVPAEFAGVIDYVDVDGRTKIAVKGRVSEYIPNPTFEKVAAPGAQEDYFRRGNPERKTAREIMGAPISSLPAFREPAPRLALMDEQGIDRVLLWPTLASLIEERLRDDPLATHAVVHALNRWMHEHWSFNYEGRIFPAPIITLPIVDKAVEELAWVVERGARVILVRPAPVPGVNGPRSFALPEFDPFWEEVERAGVLVGMHASDSGYQRHIDEWEGRAEAEYTPFKSFSAFAMIVGRTHRPVFDAMASAIGHGMLTRFPRLRIAPVENGAGWVAPLLDTMAYAYRMFPQLFEEDPAVVFRRSVAVHPFHEDDPVALASLVGVDNVIFGSDFPHPEGLADPISYVDRLAGFDDAGKAKIMGGNLARLVRVSERAAA
jgi:predicted TIM-barrel fold metal-dependent hydrolase